MRAPRPLLPRPSLPLAFACACLLTPLEAQCATELLAGESLVGVIGSVHAVTAWDPDGPGPLAERIVVAGRFPSAGAVIACNIAAFDPAAGTWSPLGEGLGGTPADEVLALAVMPNGDLVAGGHFDTTGSGVVANHVARFDGTTWSAFGAGLPGSGGGTRVRALAVTATGELFAAGTYFGSGGTGRVVYRWDAPTWTALTTGMFGSDIRALHASPAGIVYAGNGTSSGRGQVYGFDGTTWSPVGASIGIGASSTDRPVHAITTLANGDLVAGGAFRLTLSSQTNERGLARWDGTAWTGIGLASTSTVVVAALAALPGGGLIAAGTFLSLSNPTQQANNIAEWDGTTWQPLGTGTSGPVAALALGPTGALFAGGDFDTASGVPVGNIGIWDGTSWGASNAGGLPTSNAADVDAVAPLRSGDLVVGGGFQQVDGVAALGVARRSGNGWSAIGTGLDGNVDTVVELPNGDLVAGGSFDLPGGTSDVHVASWDGTAWSALLTAGTGGNGFVDELAVAPDGSLLAAGVVAANGGAAQADVLRWDGSSWTALGTWPGEAPDALLVLDDGTVLASSFVVLGGGGFASELWRWDGATWASIGLFTATTSSLPRAYDLVQLPGGDVAVIGDFDAVDGVAANGVARWNGASWTALAGGAGFFRGRTIAVLPDGSLVAGGQFAEIDGVLAAGLARYQDGQWSEFEGGADDVVYDLATLADGGLALGGDFRRVGDVVTGRIALWTTNCPSTLAEAGAGCVRSNGRTASLAARNLPWSGTTFRSHADDLPDFAFGISVTGFAAIAPGFPLASALAQALPGCDLHVAPDVLDLFVPVGGAAEFSLVLPAAPALVGASFWQQVLALEVDAQLNVLEITAANALQLTIGSY